MKFCGKCHKLIVKKIINPNNMHRICSCDSDNILLLGKDVVSRMRAQAPGTATKNERKICMRIVKGIHEGSRARE